MHVFQGACVCACKGNRSSMNAFLTGNTCCFLCYFFLSYFLVYGCIVLILVCEPVANLLTTEARMSVQFDGIGGINLAPAWTLKSVCYYYVCSLWVCYYYGCWHEMGTVNGAISPDPAFVCVHDRVSP